MPRIGGSLGYRLLRRISPGGSRTGCSSGDPYTNVRKLDVLFGPEFWDDISGKIVVDFGCGNGTDAIEFAARGAKRVIGIDIRESVLDNARVSAKLRNQEEACKFTTSYDGQADTIVSVDAFEHFESPSEVLAVMETMLAPEGVIWISFGPPWYHPHGGHLFSVFPWAHLIFSEQALIRWRSDFKSDGATRFSEVEGGLNQMTIRRFKAIIETSIFEFDRVELIPIRRLRYLSSSLTREFCTSVVRCRLTRADGGGQRT